MGRTRVILAAGLAAALAIGLSAALALAAPDATASDSAALSERQQVLRVVHERLATLLDEASVDRLPPLVPPTPVRVRWRARRISS
ncbi:MAG: hypothetical protein AAGC55_13055, partial [Myxococcota bacterium]